MSALHARLKGLPSKLGLSALPEGARRFVLPNPVGRSGDERCVASSKERKDAISYQCEKVSAYALRVGV